MTIETLFNVGDEVHYLQGTKLKKNIIHSIDIEAKGDGVKIRYCFKDMRISGCFDWDFAYESEVFETLDEFKKQLQS